MNLPVRTIRRYAAFMASGFGQFCPIAVACEVFAERWTPIILRELFAGSERFNQIHRGIPLISRALLARRLRALGDAGIISKESSPGGRGVRYRLTDAGREFKPIIDALGAWGQRWTVRVRPENLDAGLLMWNMRRRVDREQLPEQRVVVCVRFSGLPRSYRGPRVFWLMLQRSDVELCIEDPGFEVDLQVEADMATMARVWLGDIAFDDALRSRHVRLIGPRKVASAFPRWLMLSPYASVSRPATLVARVKADECGVAVAKNKAADGRSLVQTKGRQVQLPVGFKG